MEKYLGVGFESPQYRGVVNKIFLAIASYMNQETANYFETQDKALEEDEEPSDLDEILATCTSNNAEDMEPHEDGFEPFYIDTIPEEKNYLWRRIYPLTEQEGSIYPVPENITDSVLMDAGNWAVA
jgi:hypothetical protein